MFAPDPDLLEVAGRWLQRRIEHGAALGTTASREFLTAELCGPSITDHGLGLDEAWHRFADVVVPNTIGLSSPRFLAFIPAAPTAAAAMMDAAVSVAGFSAESWMEAAGAVHAENEVLRFLADAAGFPGTAGGCFVSGGSIGNLSALAVARDQRPRRPALAAGESVHASVVNVAHLLGQPLVRIPASADGRLRGVDVSTALREHPEIGTVVASAGTTNAGLIDELGVIAEACSAGDVWLHVDGAYGGAGLLVPELADRYAGLERADSFIVDPHKWLFAPLGSCALLYRDPDLALAVHTQRASYLDALHEDVDRNPADLAFQLTRRAGGLPLWFSLAVHGVEAHGEAVRRGIHLASRAAERIRQLGDPLELVLEPELSVVLVRRRGYTEEDWRRWSRELLAAGTAFVTPTRWRGETVGRLVFLHPETPESLIDETLAPLIR